MNAADTLLILAAAEFGPSVQRGDDPPRSAPLSWWITLAGTVPEPEARKALLALMRRGLLAANRLGELSDLADEASRLHLTRDGLASALAMGGAEAAPRSGLCDLARIELGTDFEAGVLAPSCREPALVASQIASLLLLHHRPCWSVQVMALLLKALVDSGRLDLQEELVPKAGFSVPWLRKKLAGLGALFPAIVFAKAGARAIVQVAGPLPSMVCTTDQVEIRMQDVAAVLDRAFGLAQVQPLATLARSTRIKGASTGEDDNPEEPEPEMDLDD